ncbi:hypothetical protein [Limosilactobacillus mucosae]|uniref:hypothetical protein n=1 Tax=Limosilactobacillus mucosae TaxID=97478 RepID=UPI003992EBA2
MTKVLLTGVGGNLGTQAAEDLLRLTDPKNLIFVGYDEAALAKYAEKGVDTRQADFNHLEGLADKFMGADVLGLISMPFVGQKRQQAQQNVVDSWSQKDCLHFFGQCPRSN